MKKKSTTAIENQIDKATNIEELRAILKDIPKTTFTERIYELCEEHGMTFGEVQTLSGISKSLFYAIANGTRKPQRPHVLKIGLAMKLSLEEFNELLKLAHHKELYAKNREDAIILYGLKHNKLDQIAELLADEKSKLLE